MSVLTINPDYLTVQQWADFMVPNLSQYGNLGRLDDETEWAEWGERLMNLPGLSGSIVPDPRAFENWREWVDRLNQNLSAVP